MKLDDSVQQFRMRFGKVVRKYRESKKLSQEELADICELHRTYISDIERGIKAVSINSLLKIAMALEIPPHVLIHEAEDTLKD